MLLHAGGLLSLHFNPEDGGATFLLNVVELLPDYTSLDPRATL
jgi:hypothetical protein